MIQISDTYIIGAVFFFQDGVTSVTIAQKDFFLGEGGGVCPLSKNIWLIFISSANNVINIRFVHETYMFMNIFKLFACYIFQCLNSLFQLKSMLLQANLPDEDYLWASTIIFFKRESHGQIFWNFIFGGRGGRVTLVTPSWKKNGSLKLFVR